MKVHLMYKDQDFSERSGFLYDDGVVFQDLEVGTLLAAMAGGDRYLFSTATAALVSGVDDCSVITYRQEVLRDCLAHPEVAREMYAIAEAAFEGNRRIFGFLSRHPSGILNRSLQSLELFVGLLNRLRQLADAHLGEFRSDGMSTLMAMLVRELDDDYFATIDHHLRELKFHGGVLLSARLGAANKGTDFVLRAPRARAGGWKARLGIGVGPSYSFELHPRDEAGARALAEIRDRGINLVANALAQSMDHVLSFLTLLRSEVGFYVGCINLHEWLTGKGEPVCLPTPRSWEPASLSASDLYDPCLSLTIDRRVVGNEVRADGRSLLIITGANSGGKSTFLRSVGLAQLMMQCGMFVAATRYEASVCSGIATHFIRKEDPSMTSGKLDEELSRMSAIVDRVQPRCLVLCNESFSSTNEREGSEIARQVIRAFLDSAIKVCFVTHLFDLAESLRSQEPASTLFLRADRQTDGRRSFALVEGDPLPTSFGEDLYRQIFSSRPVEQPTRGRALSEERVTGA